MLIFSSKYVWMKFEFSKFSTFSFEYYIYYCFDIKGGVVVTPGVDGLVDDNFHIR